MRDYPVVHLPQSLMRRCEEYGRMRVRLYDTGRNSTAESACGAEHNPVLQALAKMGECAFCMYTGESVELLNWGEDPDKGYDCPHDRLTYDVKTIELLKRYCCWAKNKNHRFHQVVFDRIALVKAAPPIFQMAGFVDKDVFFRNKRIADGSEHLIPGTWYVPEDELEPADVILSWRHYFRGAA